MADFRGPFIVYALPRSRTAWLAAFLTYRDWACGHEQAVCMRGMQDVRAVFSRPNSGTVETGAAQGWRIIAHYVPGIRTAVIRRPVEDVVRSMLAVDISGVATYNHEKLWQIMRYGERMLAQISAQPGTFTIDFDDLPSEPAVAGLFEHCLPYKFDRQWWLAMKDRNIQVDVKAHLAYCLANRSAIDRFKSICKSELRALSRADLVRA